MLTDPAPQFLQAQSNPVAVNPRPKYGLGLMLICLIVLLSWIGFTARHVSSTAASPRDSVTESLRLQEAATPSYLAFVAWPAAFEIPFKAYVAGRPGAWLGTLQYQYAEANGQSNASFKSHFSHCPELPGVPLRFFGRPCEFYLFRDPAQKNAYASYVYSSYRKEYFQLATNFGPPAQDMIARYQAIQPVAPTSAPPASGLPVTHPKPATVAVQWFLTIGQSIKQPTPSPVPSADLGYYAAIAEPVVGPDGNKYKPPFSFGGAPPGFHMALVPGQLVYEWRLFKISPQFKPGTFTPPSGYRAVPSACWPLPQMNCPVCHLSDPPHQQQFFIEPKRQGVGPCPTPSPTP